MKALSLVQPWATLMTLGAKTMETRTRDTKHRGLTVIHASKTMPCKRGETLRVGRYTVTRVKGLPDEDDVLTLHWSQRSRPRTVRLWQGCLLGYGNLVATERVETARRHALDSGQYELGDYTPGRWAWYITGVRRLQLPLIVPGALGFFDLDPTAVGVVQAQVDLDMVRTAQREALEAAADGA